MGKGIEAFVSGKGWKTDLDNDVLGDPWNPIFYLISIVGRANREGSTKEHPA